MSQRITRGQASELIRLAARHGEPVRVIQDPEPDHIRVLLPGITDSEELTPDMREIRLDGRGWIVPEKSK